MHNGIMDEFIESLSSKPANEQEAARCQAWMMYHGSRSLNLEGARLHWAGIACQIEAIKQAAPLHESVIEIAERVSAEHGIGGAQ